MAWWKVQPATVWLRRALVASVSVPIVLLGVFAWLDYERLLEEASGEAVRTVALLREHALKALETNELLVRQVDQRTRDMSWNDIRLQSASLSTDMRVMHQTLPQISVLGLSDREGRLWAGTLPVGEGGQDFGLVADREYWSAQRDRDQGTFISRSYVGRASRTTTFGISRRRMTPDGSFDGVIHSAVAVSYFTDFWKQATKNQPGMSVTLVRTDGEVLARLPVLQGPLPRLITASSPLMQALSTQPDSGVYRRPSSVDGADRIYAYSRIGQFPLVIGYGVPVAAVSAVWRNHVLILGLVTLLGAAAMSLLILLALKQAHSLSKAHALRAAAEAAARQAQRMELLGQLAAGVAHDFSNVVQAVGSGAALIEKSVDLSRIHSIAGMIRQAGERGQSLCRRMLDFARTDDGGAETPAVHEPAEAVAELCGLLAASLAPRHRLRCEITRDGLPSSVRGARQELEAALMNLAANARDAMPDGGEVLVTVGTEQVGFDRVADLAPGRYARVSVIDTGVGMPESVLTRAGEPFFTTKPRGKGTGIGLSGVRAFAERVGGALQIASEPGRGTTVSILLPDAVVEPDMPVAENVTRLHFGR